MKNRLPGRPFGNRKAPSCKDVAQVLQVYLDGELDDRDIAAIQVHLDACKDCGMEARAYEVLKAAVAARRTVVDEDVLSNLRMFVDQLSDGSEAV